MSISASGSGDRKLFVSYISEVPVWKSTYRILLPTKPDAKPILQGWAIVDNTVGEDWKDVQLSLVAGAPHPSFRAFQTVLHAPSGGGAAGGRDAGRPRPTKEPWHRRQPRHSSMYANLVVYRATC